MATFSVSGAAVRGIATSVPQTRFNNITDTKTLPAEEVRKIVAMAGVVERRVAGDTITSSDLCYEAATALLQDLDWSPDSVDALVMVTQTPDYLMPSSSCLVHRRLGLSDRCAAFDVGLGCSGYVYGLWLSAMMLNGGDIRRVLLLHGETPTRYVRDDDRAVSLLFGDAGSATAIERSSDPRALPWHFALHTDGGGYKDLIIEAGGFRDRFSPNAADHYVHMNGANVFNFTIKSVPPLIDEILSLAGRTKEDIDYFVFHQSNRFIIQHLIRACGLAADKVPLILDRYGNCGGPSLPLTITEGVHTANGRDPSMLLLLGYGAGLSWGAALLPFSNSAVTRHVEHTNSKSKSG